MKKPFFARFALPILMVVFFLVPFALRGARFALQQMKNNVKDWLPDRFAETTELEWFRDHFLGEQFVVVSWGPTTAADGAPNHDGCTEDSPRYKLLLQKLTTMEVPPSQQPESPAENEDADAGERRGAWTRPDDFIGDRLRLHATGDYCEDWGGRGEKWLKGSGEHGEGDYWYFITPEGDLYRWDGGDSLMQAVGRGLRRLATGRNSASGDLVHRFGPLDGPWYHKDPRRLTARMFKTVRTGPQVLAELTARGKALDPQRVEHGHEEAQRRLKGILFGPDGKQTCVVLTLTDAAKDDLREVLGRKSLGRPQGKLLNLAQEAGIDPEDLHMGGPPVDNVAIDEEGEITLLRLVGWCVLLGVGLSYLCFRSVKATIMVFFVGGLSAVVSLAIVFWSGQVMDAVLMSMPSVVYVLGLSGAVHIMNYYRDAVEEKGLEGAPQRAIAHGAYPCTLAALTTALGLGSLYASEILPIRKFGLFSAAGVMATLILLFTYLPSALQVWPLPQRKKRKKISPVETAIRHMAAAARDRFVSGLIRYNGWVCVGCLVVSAVFAIGLTKITTSIQLIKLFDSHAKIIRDYAWLETHLGKLVPMELVVCIDPKLQRPAGEALEHLDEAALHESRFQLSMLERMEAAATVQRVIEQEFGETGQNVVGRAMSAATFAPPMPGSGASLGSFSERSGLNAALAHRRDDLLASDYLRVDQTDGYELWRISLRLGALSSLDYGEFVGQLKRAVEPVASAYRCRERILRELDKQNGGGNFARSKVLVLGYSFQPSTDGKQKAPSEKTAEQDHPATSAESADTRWKEVAEHKIDQTKIFATTLKELLQKARLGGRRIRGHDPKRTPFPAGYATSDEWAAVLAAQDCVVLASDHPDYDVDFIRRHSKLVVDARDFRFDPNASPPRVAVADPNQAGAGQHVIKKKPGLTIVYTGVVPLVYKAQRTLLESLKISIGWAFVLIALVMIALLRSPTAGLAAMLPNVFPVVIIFGAMGWSGIAVDIGSMMTASVAMGVAVDDTIHFLTWFRWGLNEGMDRKRAILVAYRRVSLAMMQTTIIGGLGMAIFALSTFTPTQRFGYLMLFLLAAALFGDLVFLPAILAGPVGLVFRPSTRRKRKDAATKPDEPIGADEPDATRGATPHAAAKSLGSKTHQVVRRDRPH